MAEPTEVTILLLGNSKIGKTTFLSRISQGAASKQPLKLLRDLDQPYPFEIRSRDRFYRFEFFDTGSPENWRLLRPNVVVLCYDISNRLSLIDMRRTWHKEALTHFLSSPEIPILVLGLKRDLRSEDDPNGIIYPQEAYRIAQEMRCDKYMECSAATGELMTEAFEDICRSAAATATEAGGQSDGGCNLM